MASQSVEDIFLIAEIGQAHDGSLGIAHSYIDALSETGVDAVKFQTHIAEAESSSFEKFRINFSYEDATRYDYWRRMEFTPQQWLGLKEHCEAKGLEFISSPFSNAAVPLLETLNVKRYKIGSGEINNCLLLKQIADTGKPIILSTGMSSFEELDKTIEFLRPYHNDLTFLQCTTAYPTTPEEWGLNIIAELRDRYKLPIGFSDHSGDIYACLAAASLGAKVLEFHVVFDKRMFGPDARSSLSMDQVASLVNGVRMIQRSLRCPVNKNENSKFNELKINFGKSLCVNRPIQKGDIFDFHLLEAKKPAELGISPCRYENVVGKRAKNNLAKWDFVTEADIDD
jgi:N-acetylneuraminate synthase